EASNDNEQTNKLTINFDTGTHKENSIILIEELLTLIEPTQEKKIEKKIEKLEMNDELAAEQVEQIKDMLKQGHNMFAQSISELDCIKIVEH
ncbi:14858_t:CDS:1, partial [Acaulospora morrowiae]